MQGISLFPHPDHLVTIGRGKPSAPIAGFAATYGLGGRISRGLGGMRRIRGGISAGGLPRIPFAYGGAQSASPIRLAGRGRRDLDEAAGTQQDQRG